MKTCNCCVCTECDAYGGTRNGVTTVARNTCLNEDSPAFMTKADLKAIAFGCVFGCRHEAQRATLATNAQRRQCGGYPDDCSEGCEWITDEGCVNTSLMALQAVT